MLTPPQIEKWAQKAMRAAFILLFFLTPLILTTVNYELFEFNKMLFAYLLTITILFLWSIKAISGQKFNISTTSLFKPLSFFLLTQILATIFSISPRTSFFGYYTRLNGGLLSSIAYFILYLALVNNFSQQEVKTFLKALIASAFLVASYGVLEHWGIDARYWVQDVRRRVFSTLGQPNWLAAWLDGLIFLPLAFAFTSPPKKKTSHFLLFSLFLTCLLFTRSRSGFLAYVAGFLVFASLGFVYFKNQRKKFLLFLVTPILINLILIFIIGAPVRLSFQKIPSVPTVPEEITPQRGGSPSETIRLVVWKGALSLGKKYPLLGTGPETFAYAYYWVRPQEHNLLSEWDFLYNKAHNEYLNYLATSGLLGLGSYLAFILASTILSLKKFFSSPAPDKTKAIHLALFSGWLTILITNFFGFSVVAVNLLFFLFPGLIVLLYQKENKTDHLPQIFNRRKKILLLVCFLLFCQGILWVKNYWYADYLFSQAEKENKSQRFSSAQKKYQQALRIRPHESLYLSHAATNLAFLSLNQKNKDDQLSLIAETQELSQKSLAENPYDLNNYRQIAQTFYILSTIAPSYLQEVEKILLTASKLAPTDPKLLYNLGALKFRQGKTQEAIEYLEKSIDLKPNYELARLELAKIYLQEEDKEKAQQQLKYLLEKINPQNKEAQELIKKIAL